MLQSISANGSVVAAATPTFSPAAGAVSNPTTVTPSTTSDTCTIYTHHKTSAGVTAADSTGTYSVTGAVTLYAKVIGCPGFKDSAESSAAYTISGGGGPVAVDAVMTTGNGGGGNHAQASGVQAISTTGMTVGSSATLLVVSISMNSGTIISGFTCSWDTTGTAQPMAMQANSGFGEQEATALFTLVNPHAGNKTLGCSWTGAGDIYISAISFTGTNTSTGVNASDNVTNPSGNSLAITSDTSGATVASFVDSGGGTSPNSTGGFVVIFDAGNLSPDGGANYKLGGTTNTHTAGETVRIAGIHVIP